MPAAWSVAHCAKFRAGRPAGVAVLDKDRRGDRGDIGFVGGLSYRGPVRAADHPDLP